MSSVREKIRGGWTPILVKPQERFAHKIGHMELRKWCDVNCQGKYASTLVKGSYNDPASLHSSFAFENEEDASYFALRWK